MKKTNWEYEYNRLVESALQLNKMYKEKSRRIDKAIEYISCHFKEMVADEEAQILLDILKGVNKE